MCTRCVRFTREITQTGELQVMNRGSHAEINIFPGHPVDNPLAGNVVDLCPVGALLDKDFLHKQRYWFLSRHDAICTACSTGCNIYSEENRGALWRFRPRANPHVNDYWICDEGRASYKTANDPALLHAAYVRRADGLVETLIDQALNAVGQKFKQMSDSGGILAGVLSPSLTVEEAYLMASYLKGLNPANVLALGPVPRQGVDQTFTPDPHEGRTGDTSFVVPRPFTIHAEKCPNRRGVEAVLAHFQGEVIPYETLAARASQGEFRGLYIASDAIVTSFNDEDVRLLRPKVDFLVVQDTSVTPLAQAADVVLAGATFAEKAGCYVNFQNRLQYAEAALPPRDGSLPDLDLFAILLGRGAGPIRSRDVLIELAATIPAFSVVTGGEVPTFGVVLNEPPTAGDGQTRPFVYREPWLTTRGDRHARLQKVSPREGEPA